MSPPESFSFLFHFLFPLSPRPFLTKEKEERGKRKISGRVDIISCCTPGRTGVTQGNFENHILIAEARKG
jgi:hypothetical protein